MPQVYIRYGPDDNGEELRPFVFINVENLIKDILNTVNNFRFYFPKICGIKPLLNEEEVIKVLLEYGYYQDNESNNGNTITWEIMEFSEPEEKGYDSSEES